jgi:acyl-[acyl-carrier-protein] desaturase
MEQWAQSHIEPMLVPSSKCWQPADLLPDAASPDFLAQVETLRKECKRLPAEFLVVLVGDMVTEEALPSYMSMLNRMDGTRDHSGTARAPFCCDIPCNCQG